MIMMGHIPAAQFTVVLAIVMAFSPGLMMLDFLLVLFAGRGFAMAVIAVVVVITIGPGIRPQAQSHRGAQQIKTLFVHELSLTK
jgi:hypothetical protein